MRVHGIAFFRNDVGKDLGPRLAHLRDKRSAHADVTWQLVVGDSDDATETTLAAWAAKYPAMRVQRIDTGIVGEDIDTRRHRLAVTATAAFAAIPSSADLVLLHESDLVTPVDVIDQFLPTVIPNVAPVAGWPILPLPTGTVFYDIWAYRHLDGRHFQPSESRPYSPFHVASFGSCWLAPADLVRGRVLGDDCIVDLCRQWRAEGRTLWVDPRVEVIQPVDRWTLS